MNFYGPAVGEDGGTLAAGTLVLAVDPDGTVCGATRLTQSGRYGLLACYGDDPATDADEGAQPGDKIRLEVDGAVLAEGVWTGNGERLRLPLGPWEARQTFLPLILHNSTVSTPEADQTVDPSQSSHKLWLPWIGRGR